MLSIKGNEMIWLIGCKGMLGTELGKQLTDNNISWVGTDSEVDITDQSALDSFALSHSPSAEMTGSSALNGHVGKKITWIINCSAYTNVDKAESDQDIAAKLNTEGPLHIARTARRINAKLIHISTDYVYDGKSSVPYTEEMPFSPINAYGKTKADGENAIHKEMTQYYILRTSWLYGFTGNDNDGWTYIIRSNTHDLKAESKAINERLIKSKSDSEQIF